MGNELMLALSHLQYLLQIGRAFEIGSTITPAV